MDLKKHEAERRELRLKRVESKVMQTTRWGGKELDYFAEAENEDRARRLRMRTLLKVIQAFKAGAKVRRERDATMGMLMGAGGDAGAGAGGGGGGGGLPFGLGFGGPEDEDVSEGKAVERMVMSSFLSLPELQADTTSFELKPRGALAGTKSWYGYDGHLNIERTEEELERRRKKKKTKIQAQFWWHLPVILKKVEVESDDEDERVAEARRLKEKREKREKKRARKERKQQEKQRAVIAEKKRQIAKKKDGAKVAAGGGTSGRADRLRKHRSKLRMAAKLAGNKSFF